jgi:hypothetical protein
MNVFNFELFVYDLFNRKELKTLIYKYGEDPVIKPLGLLSVFKRSKEDTPGLPRSPK